MSLKAIIDTLSEKIAAASTGSSPEELAYLASAVEKIGGRVSVFDLVDHVEDQKTQLSLDISTVKADAVAAINSVLADGITELTNLNNTVSATVLGLESQVASIIADAQTQINSILATAIAGINTAKSDGIAAVNSAASTATNQIYGSRSRLFYLINT